jgi:hypothetical protein
MATMQVLLQIDKAGSEFLVLLLVHPDGVRWSPWRVTFVAFVGLPSPRWSSWRLTFVALTFVAFVGLPSPRWSYWRMTFVAFVCNISYQ